MGDWHDRLDALCACADAREWAAQYESAQSAWDACERPDWMLWLLVRLPETRVLGVRFATDVAERVVHLAGDARTEAAAAIAAARAWCDRPCEDTRSAAAAAAAAALERAAAAAAYAAYAAAYAAAAALERAAAAAAYAADAAARAAAARAARAAERRWQIAHIRASVPVCPLEVPRD